jgi:hypothetical protein
MKKIALIIGLMIVLLSMNVLGFAGGNGSVSSPFQISTCTHLQAMNKTNLHYELINDIDCSATTSWNSGQGFDPIDTGSLGIDLEGNNYAILDLFMNRTGENVGLFEDLSPATVISNISNLYIIDAHSICHANGTDSDCGIITGEFFNGYMDNVHISGQLDHTTNGDPGVYSWVSVFGQGMWCKTSPYDCYLDKVSLDVTINADFNYTRGYAAPLAGYLWYTDVRNTVIESTMNVRNGQNTDNTNIESCATGFVVNHNDATYSLIDHVITYSVLNIENMAAAALEQAWITEFDLNSAFTEYKALDSENYTNVTNYFNPGSGWVNYSGNPCGDANCSIADIEVLNDSAIKSASTYSGWNASIWNITDGLLPELLWVNLSQFANNAPTDPTDITGFPSNLYVNDTLTVTASGSTDSDNDSITYEYQFYNFNESSILQAWSTDNSYTVQASDENDTIIVGARAYDGEDYSGDYNESDIVEYEEPSQDPPGGGGGGGGFPADDEPEQEGDIVILPEDEEGLDFLGALESWIAAGRGIISDPSSTVDEVKDAWTDNWVETLIVIVGAVVLGSYLRNNKKVKKKRR